MVILQKYVLGSVSVLPRQCPATLFRAFPKGGAGRPFLHCTAIYLYLVSQIFCQRHSTLRSIPPLAMCYNFPVTSAKDSLKSYFCPISRWEGRCPVLRSSSKLVGLPCPAVAAHTWDSNNKWKHLILAQMACWTAAQKTNTIFIVCLVGCFLGLRLWRASNTTLQQSPHPANFCSDYMSKIWVNSSLSE